MSVPHVLDCIVINCHLDQNVPNKQESRANDLFKKQKTVQELISKKIFYRDQNPNWLYLQGPKAYLSQEILYVLFYKIVFSKCYEKELKKEKVINIK
jgi:hypothetical protein